MPDLRNETSPEKLADAASDKTPSTVEGQPVVAAEAFSDDRWIQAVAGLDGQKPAFHWRHVGIEALLAGPVERRPDLPALVKNSNAVVAANAAIALAQAGNAQGAVALVAAVRNPEFKLPVRLAAAESLGALDAEETAGRLQALVDELGQFAGPALSTYSPALHAELLASLAAREAPAGDERFVTACQSPAPEVRRAALVAWAAQSTGELPAVSAQLYDDIDPRVRMAALEALIAHRAPTTEEALLRALDDNDLNVRTVAIAGLGTIGGEQARARLDKLRKHPSELARAAVVGALAKLGVERATIEAAEDKSWRVRQAVAETLKQDPQSKLPVKHDTVVLAQQLVRDMSVEVQRQTLYSLETWPLEQAGPVLLAAMTTGGYDIRKRAAAQLTRRWPPAAEFPSDGGADRRTAAISQLQQRWTDEFKAPSASVAQAKSPVASVVDLSQNDVAEIAKLVSRLGDESISGTARDEVVRALVAYGAPLVAVLEQQQADGSALPAVIFSEVLPKVGPAFAPLAEMRSSDVRRRRIAAAALVTEAAARPLSPLAIEQIVDRAPLESDPLVWQCYLTVTAHDASESGVRLAYLASSQADAEVRRRACDYLAAHGDVAHLPLLMPLLHDRHAVVVVAAVRAVGAAGAIDDPAPLVKLLLSADKQVRLETAASLVRLNSPEGIAALERLALDADVAVRRRAAQIMGELNEPVFLPTLVAILADNIDVQRSALDSLTKIVGHDVSGSSDAAPLAPDERARRWQRWYLEHAGG